MNLIDFHVTKILSEKYDKIYKLFNMTNEELEEEQNEQFKEFLVSDGVKQTYEYWDDGGINNRTDIFKVGKQYYVGYIGQH